MIDPIDGPFLRDVNAVLSMIFAPVLYFVIFRSGHHESFLYRLGMFCILAGLVNNIVLWLGWLPLNLETWMLKDLGIYITVTSLAMAFCRGGGFRS